MRRNTFILMMLLCLTTVSIGQKVDHITATNVASSLYRKYVSKDVKVSSILTLGLKHDTLIYVVNFEKTGFALVSGYYSAEPILGQCFNNTFDTLKMPPGLLFLIERYKYGILGLKENSIEPSSDLKKKWETILSPAYSNNKSYTIGNFMVPTTWDQVNGYDYFETTFGQVGCTGVAMAQILYYWRCRVNGDLHNYMWINMGLHSPDTNNARLIQDCSYACMTLPDGTSTPMAARDGFVNHFGINSNVDVKWRLMHLLTWEDMLKDEIDLERPVLYSGGSISGGGHSWVIDGYNEEGKFHCNWGWSGDWDNFYYMGDFHPGPNGPYDQIESAIFNIVPIHTNGVDTPTLSDHSFNYNSNGYALSVQPVYGATSYEWTTQYGTISGTGPTVNLNSDFTTKVYVRAYNNRCQIYSPYDTANIIINYGPISGHYVLCSSGYQYSIPNVPSGASITWSCGSFVSRNSPQGSNPCTFVATGTGSSYLRAIITTSHGSSTLPDYTIWCGKFESTWVNGTAGVCPNSLYTYTAVIPGGHKPEYSYSWAYPSGWYNNGQNQNSINLQTPMYNMTYGAVRVSITNACGTSGYSGITVYPKPGGCGGYFAIYPNPASDDVTIAINESFSDEEIGVENYTIRIFNNQGGLMLTFNRSGQNFTIPLGTLKDGIYIVELNDGKNSYRQQVVVKRN